MTLLPNLYHIDDFTSWKKELDEQGFSVIKNILTDDEHNKGLRLFQEEMSKISPNFNLSEPETFKIENTPLMFGKGMAIFNGWGQSDFMWHLRTNSRIKSIYQKLFQTPDLVTSLDGFSLFVSPKQKSPSWLHIDQNPKNSIYSIQGSYNYLPVTENDAGLVIVPKSHLSYKPEVDHNKDWIVVDNKEFKPKQKKLLIPKNCFTLWNSKLIHANEGFKTKTNNFNRLTCYLTYLNKDLRSLEVLEKRKKAYLNGDATSHWSNKCELKRYPWGFGPRYDKRGFGKLDVRLENETIPPERLKLL